MRRAILYSLLIGSCFLILSNWFWTKYTFLPEGFNKANANCYKNPKSVLSCEEMIRETIYTCSLSTQPRFLLSSHRKDITPSLSAEDNQRKTYLTIGIPSVKRKTDNYLFQTLQSIIKGSSREELQNITIVVLVADVNSVDRHGRIREIKSAFEDHIKSGLLHIIETTPSIYPPFITLHQTYNDSMERVHWRSKQVIDFALLFNYSVYLSDYFLILEDDVLCAPHFITAVREFIDFQQESWVSLTFTGFLIIGRLLKSSDLPRLVSFLMLFYSEKPIDLLILQFIDLLVPSQRTIIRRIPSLFQHIGLRSSLDGKIQKLKDKTFTGVANKFEANNPSADIITTITTYDNFYPELAYNSGFGYFWGQSPKINDTFDVIFHKPSLIEHIYIETGSKDHNKDILLHGVVEVGLHFIKMESSNKPLCSNYTMVGSFKNGKAEINSLMHQHIPIQCIRIRVLQKQSNWLVISQIAIF
ncbi:alpha-1,3-mannosyl-glycoprotein 4-beta-N-acetylglucosaminyltransferase C-like [Centruroides sculpturatus]|uniref:alpha-1,3-mannosyl-glycoprotein 4-beta-N-acetylglucosaminyltransferase C-like n=1 Tax=Centruroides sculpturatus TaxID=218467 RepID=UPI000C6E9832|nr:alpha-1,3-mannosyl-glycoprotein 4-beta-N-acetylglucosaminyltransferase C-like [Centruroides sculpturatus]